MIARFPEQLAEALTLASRIQLNRHNSPLRNVLISGLGGSGIGGNFVQCLVADTCKLPVLVNKGYTLPQWVGKHTLAICSSYSGNTEETLGVFEQLKGTGAKIVVVTSGGALLEQAAQIGADAVRLPGGWSSPRACLGYSAVAQLGVLHALKLISARPLRQIAAAQKLLVKDQGDIRKRAQKLAGFLAQKNPVLYCSDHIEAVALRWRQQINENAKMLCWHHVVPEMNHNELVGWRDQRPDIAAVWLRNRNDLPRNILRMNINKEIIEHFAGSSIEVYSKGKSLAEQVFYLTHLGDWLSFYLAELRQVDPVEIKVIDFLKNELAQADLA